MTWRSKATLIGQSWPPTTIAWMVDRGLLKTTPFELTCKGKRWLRNGARQDLAIGEVPF